MGGDRRLREAAGAVLDEWDAHRGDLLLNRRMDDLRAALREAPPPAPDQNRAGAVFDDPPAPPNVWWRDGADASDLIADGRLWGTIRRTDGGDWAFDLDQQFKVRINSRPMAKWLLLAEWRRRAAKAVAV